MDSQATALQAIAQPNPSALALDQLLHNRESHAATFDFVARFERLEHAEYPIVKAHWDARAVISHCKFDEIWLNLRVDPNSLAGQSDKFLGLCFIKTQNVAGVRPTKKARWPEDDGLHPWDHCADSDEAARV